jgi:hypothetical protein
MNDKQITIRVDQCSEGYRAFAAAAARRRVSVGVLLGRIYAEMSGSPALIDNVLDDEEEIARLASKAPSPVQVARARSALPPGVCRPGRLSGNEMTQTLRSATPARASGGAAYVPGRDRYLHPDPKQSLQDILAEAVRNTAKMPSQN